MRSITAMSGAAFSLSRRRIFMQARPAHPLPAALRFDRLPSTSPHRGSIMLNTSRTFARAAAGLALAAGCLFGAADAIAQQRAPAATARAVDITVQNQTRRTLSYLYVAQPNAVAWGEDRLGSESIAPRARFQFRMEPGPCVRDMRAVYDDGSEETRFNVDLCMARRQAFSGAANAPLPQRGGPALLFRIRNDSQAQASALQVVPAGADPSDTDELLDAGVLEPGGTVTGRIARGGCRFDVIAAFDDDEARQERRTGVDLCAEPELGLAGPTPATPGSAPPNAAQIEVIVANRTSLILSVMKARPSGTADWGPDRLGADVIPPGETYRFAIAAGSACLFDLQAVFSNGRTEVRERQDLCADPSVAYADVPFDPATMVDLGIVNGGSETLYILNIRPAGARDWGPDRFGSDVVPAGGTFRVRLMRSEGCVYDVRLIYENRREEVREGVDLCADPTLTFTGPVEASVDPATTLEVSIANRGSGTLFILYLRPAGTRDWGQDRFGSDVVPAGGDYRVRLSRNDGCVYDVRLLYADQREEVRQGVDLCAQPTLTFTAPPDERPADGDVFDVTVSNGSGATVFALYMRVPGASGWSRDLLGQNVLPNGRDFRVRVNRQNGCRFETRVVFVDRSERILPSRDLCADPRLAVDAPDPAQFVQVTVQNRSPQVLFALYLRPAGTSDWGPDRFGADVVAVGQSYRVNLDRSAGCRFDVRLVYNDQSDEVREGVDLCADPILSFSRNRQTGQQAPAAGDTFDVTVTNRSGVTLYALFLRPEGAQAWSRDMLGSSVVENGRDFRLRVNRRAGCTFETRLVFTDRSERVLPVQDLCATPQIAVSAPDPSQALQVTIANRSQQILFALFLRRAGTADWGPDRFGSDVVDVGRTYRLRLDRSAGCTFDVRMIYADRSNNRSEEVRTGVDLCTTGELAFTGPTANARGRGRIKEQTESQEAPAQISEVTIVNRSAVPVESFHASSSRVNEWLADRLTDGVIAPGTERTFQIERDGQCMFDLRVTYVGGREERRMRVDICTTPRFVFMGPDERLVDGGGPPDGRLVTVVNVGPIELRELYMTSVDDTHWGDDRLGANTLPRRWRVELRVPTADGCRYDVRAVFRSGAALERRNVDICADATIRFEQRHSPGSLVSTGTGFYVSPQGHILTNQHVVDGCSVIALFRPGQPPVTLRLIAEDERADLALLQQEGARPTPLAFRGAGQPVRAGERVVVIGYPVRQELGGVNVTEGLLSAVRGQRGDARRFQYSAPTQPGNSGGPVFDETGQVIGVVVSQLAGLGEDRSAQNINFGIALSEVRRFLEANGVTPVAGEAAQPQRPADLLDRVGPSVLPLDCLG
jgi:S1-C subfamily serine protease